MNLLRRDLVLAVLAATLLSSSVTAFSRREKRFRGESRAGESRTSASLHEHLLSAVRASGPVNGAPVLAPEKLAAPPSEAEDDLDTQMIYVVRLLKVGTRNSCCHKSVSCWGAGGAT